MPYPFADILFTPGVEAAQAENGSREFCAALAEKDRDFRLGPREAAFIAERDHFFMATISQSGWPYLQHRGGPRGFIQILDERRFAFPDFRGNRQYISLGNLAGEARAAFFFIDYPSRARLKALARVVARTQSEEPEIIERFSALGYKAAIERVFVAEVAALDWNCSQHITPRFTETDVKAAVQDLAMETEALRSENAALSERLAALENRS
ncbi:MAG TPA: pyridoxamine 5'-phosphate oxidase family protein [Parvularculaceae bacterium]|nr:pyridoxamine 5'-phosphate oxidase family protein [Parvularculaceae bacterium]